MKLRTKFQDEDFELGEVVEGVIVECLGKHEEELRVIATAAKGGQHTFYYSSIKKFMDDWEDAPEEPKKGWYLNSLGEPIKNVFGGDDFTQPLEAIGNHFATKEETEKAVEKLKALTRLSKCGFRFEGYNNRDRMNGGDIAIYAHVDTPHNNLIEDAQPDMLKDLDLLFGGKE